jgi:hypothetical protein
VFSEPGLSRGLSTLSRDHCNSIGSVKALFG